MDFTFDLEQSLESLLSSGGDSRQVTETGKYLNRYLCSMRPCPEVTPFGSCTASSISDVGYKAAKQLHRHLRALAHDTDIHSAVAERYRIIREELLFLLTRCSVPGLDVALSPSGTDAELLALAIAHGSGDRPVTNILIAPAEVGSGTPLAAAGRYFDERTPTRNRVEIGAPVDNSMAERTTLITVAVRNEEGKARSEFEIDDEIAQIVERRIALGDTVLLHVIAHSKTGLHAPSLSCVKKLKARFGEDVLVMIDAAQGRFSRRGLVRVLQDGHMVLVTGSKFFGGPPFSGALLVPEKASPSARELDHFPAGFASFFSADQLPESWVRYSMKLPETGKLGLLLRWTAAIAEIREYYSTPSELRLKVLREFEYSVPEILSSSLEISLDTMIEPVYSDKFERVLQSKTTVFSFSVILSNGTRLDSNGLRTVWRWLNEDISHLLPGKPLDCRRLLACKIHLGQPVMLSTDASGSAVLRIALGGVLLSSVAQNPEWGRTYHDRVERLRQKIFELKRKLEMIVRHHDELLRSSAFGNSI